MRHSEAAQSETRNFKLYGLLCLAIAIPKLIVSLYELVMIFFGVMPNWIHGITGSKEIAIQHGIYFDYYDDLIRYTVTAIAGYAGSILLFVGGAYCRINYVRARKWILSYSIVKIVSMMVVYLLGVYFTTQYYKASRGLPLDLDTIRLIAFDKFEYLGWYIRSLAFPMISIWILKQRILPVRLEEHQHVRTSKVDDRDAAASQSSTGTVAYFRREPTEYKSLRLLGWLLLIISVPPIVDILHEWTQIIFYGRPPFWLLRSRYPLSFPTSTTQVFSYLIEVQDLIGQIAYPVNNCLVTIAILMGAISCLRSWRQARFWLPAIALLAIWISIVNYLTDRGNTIELFNLIHDTNLTSIFKLLISNLNRFGETINYLAFPMILIWYIRRPNVVMALNARRD